MRDFVLPWLLSLLICGLLSDRAFAAEPQASIWPQLVKGMRLGGEQRPEVQRFIAHYAAHPKSLNTMLARAEPFLWFVLASTELRGLPTELALLPAVESGWNAEAVSVSAAHGLWQFIPKTGDAYGLKNGLNYNARRDPVASTRAALDLLATLHRQYGDWPLALAAYNAGGVKVKEAMGTSRSRNFWKLPLPQVTKDYVPRLLAIAALVRNPQRHGIELPQIAAAGATELIAVEKAEALQQALDAAQVDHAVLRTYNPGLAEGGQPSQSPTLLLPAADALAVRAELAFLNAAAAPQIRIKPPLRDEPVARANPTAVNPAEPVSPRAMPKIKPVPSTLRLASQLHWNARLGSADALASEEYLSTPAMHIVGRGDTLHGIAKRHRTTVAALRSLNPAVSSAPLRIGQPLLLGSCSKSGCG